MFIQNKKIVVNNAIRLDASRILHYVCLIRQEIGGIKERFMY